MNIVINKKMIILLAAAAVVAGLAIVLFVHSSGSQPVNTEIANCDNQTVKDAIVAYSNEDPDKEIDPETVDPSTYGGYIVKLKDSCSDKVVEAALENSEGVTKLEHSGLYRAESLKDIENFVDPDMLASIEPDYYVTLTDIDQDTATPNDPYYNDEESSYYQWNLRMMNASGAWADGIFGQSTDGSDEPVTVGVVDSGLFGAGGTQKQHEDIDYSKYDGGNNLATGETGTPDTHGHGTFVSGLIMATMNNGLGVTGAMPEVHIKSEKVFGSEGSCYTSTITEAVYCAIEDEVDVINMSLGGTGSDASLRAACQAAVDKGILVVASAGNAGSNVSNYPAAYDCVVGVSSIDSDWGLSYYSSYGESNVYCTAPGAKVPGLNNSTASLYKLWSGTSFSGPMVAALAAMAKSIDPEIDQAGFKELIKNTSKDLGAEGYDQYFGWGCIDYEMAAETLLADQNRFEYNVSFDLTDEGGEAVDDASIEVRAAEDISWEEYTDAEGVQHDAGSIAEGTVLTPDQDGVYSLHKGKYSYKVHHSDYYQEKGTFTTYMVKQKVKVIMRKTYQVSMEPVNSHRELIDGAEIRMTQRHGSAEETVEQSTDGSYSCRVPEGSYDCLISIDNYITRRVIVEVDGSGDVSITIPMYTTGQSCSMTISVVDDDDDSDLTDSSDIRMVDSEGNEFYPLTEGDNVYQLPRGRLCRYTVTRAGYDTAKGKCNVPSAASGSLEIRMTLTRARVDFEIYDAANEEALQGAEVLVSDEEGQAVDSVYGDPQEYNLPDGEYSYTVVEPGYGNASGGFKISFSEGKVIQVYMHQEKADVIIRVVDGSGDPIQGAELTIKDAEGKVESPLADGSYQLEPGSYGYTAYSAGYRAAKGDITVGREGLEQDIVLEEGESSGAYEGGSGTEKDPYLIANEDQLKALAAETALVYDNDVSADTNRKAAVTGYYELVDDIELTYQDGETWLPIGNFESESNYCLFSGSFDGNGHTVSNIQVASDESLKNSYMGLFGMIGSAEVKNLTVTGQVKGGYQNGGLIGGIWNVKGNKYGSTVENCSSYANVTGTRNAGGIVGSVRGTASIAVCNYIRNCSNYGDISVTTADGTGWQDNAGGLVGLAYATEIRNCSNKGTVSGRYVVGGIAAILYDNTYVYNCYNAGDTLEKGTDDSKSECGGIAAETSGNIDGAYVQRHTGSVSPVGLARKGASVENASNVSEAHMKSRTFTDILNLNDGARYDAFVRTDSYPVLWWETAGIEEFYAAEPVFTEDPADGDYICYDQAQPLQASVDMTGEHGELTYQWYSNEAADTELADKVKGAAGAVPEDGLITYIPDTDEAGTEYYYLVVTNRVDRDGSVVRNTARSGFARIQVTAGQPAMEPEIKDMTINGQSGTSAEVYKGDELSLAVLAESGDGGQLTYQWYCSSTAGELGQALPGACSKELDMSSEAGGTVYLTLAVTNTVNNGNPDNTRTIYSDVFTVTVSEQTSDEAAAAKAVELIDAIGSEVSLDSGEAIRAARIACDQLTPDQKALVAAEALEKLTAAEARYTELYEEAKAASTPSQVTGLSVQSRSPSSLKLTWDRQDLTLSYRIYRADPEGDEYKCLAEVKASEVTAGDEDFAEYLDGDLTEGSDYRYRVCAVGAFDGMELPGQMSAIASGRPVIGSPDSVTARTGKRKLTISWTAVEGAACYQVSVSTSKSKTKYAAKNTKKTTLTKKKLKKKSRYYVKVRAVSASGAKGQWTMVRSGKVK